MEVIAIFKGGGIMSLRSVSSLTLGLFLSLATLGSAQSPDLSSDTIREEDRLGARSDPYSRAFDRAISSLIKGDANGFRSMLSSTTLAQESRGPGAIDAVIQSTFIPFFSDFDELTDSIFTSPTYDASGKTGLAIARNFRTKSSEVKSFIIYLTNEVKDGKPVVSVGNLLLNKTAEFLQKAPAAKTPVPK